MKKINLKEELNVMTVACDKTLKFEVRHKYYNTDENRVLSALEEISVSVIESPMGDGYLLIGETEWDTDCIPVGEGCITLPLCNNEEKLLVTIEAEENCGEFLIYVKVHEETEEGEVTLDRIIKDKNKLIHTMCGAILDMIYEDELDVDKVEEVIDEAFSLGCLYKELGGEE